MGEICDRGGFGVRNSGGGPRNTRNTRNDFGVGESRYGSRSREAGAAEGAGAEGDEGGGREEEGGEGGEEGGA